MFLDFVTLKEQIIPNFRGGEKNTAARMFMDEYGKIMMGSLEPGASIGRHTHETSSEIIFFLKGRTKVFYDDQIEYLYRGMCHYCPPGHSHSLINDGPDWVEFFAVVPELGAVSVESRVRALEEEVKSIKNILDSKSNP